MHEMISCKDRHKRTIFVGVTDTIAEWSLLQYFTDNSIQRGSITGESYPLAFPFILMAVVLLEQDLDATSMS